MVREHNLIAVTSEYRLGALGFLTNDRLAGNQAIEDQRMVMKFVQSNIANFGGNPNMVTIWGESAVPMKLLRLI